MKDYLSRLFDTFDSHQEIINRLSEKEGLDMERSIIKKNVSFGEVINGLQLGYKASRKGWNGKGMFIYLTKGQTLTKAGDEVPNSIIEEFGMCEINDHIDMKAADNSIVVGWLASQIDMLSNDWEIFE